MILCLTILLIFIKNSFTNKDYSLGISGKSGGHIIPLINILKKNKNKKILVTTNTNLDKKIVNENINKKRIDINYFINLNNSINNLMNFFINIPNIIVYFIKIFYILFIHNIKEIYTTGGYVSIPFCMICKILKIPINLYILDSIPGKATKFIMNFSDYNYFFSNFTKEEAENFPLQFTESDIKNQNEIRNSLNIDLNKKVIFIIGGSQGSKEINDLFISIINVLNKKILNNLFIIHQTGNSEYKKIKEIYSKINLDHIIFDYSFDLLNYYSASDLVISRAGASSLYEIIKLNKPAIIIPLKNIANNHQEKNAILASENHTFIKTILENDNNIIKKNLINLIENYF